MGPSEYFQISLMAVGYMGEGVKENQLQLQSYDKCQV